MPARSETRSINAFLTTTLQEYGRTLHDNIFDDMPMLSYLNGKLGRALRGGKSIKKTRTGGERIREPLLYGRNSTASSYSGAEVLDTTLQDGITDAAFDWKQYSVSVGITGIQRRGNRGRHALINLLQAKVTQAELTLQEMLNQDAYSDGTGNDSKNIDGLTNIVSTTHTLGGINPTTNTWWQADVTTSVGSFAANGEGAMRTTFNNVTIGGAKPEVIFTTQDIYEAYEDLIGERRRYTSGKAADAGFESLLFKNKPIIFDRDCNSGEMYMLNSMFIQWNVMQDADFTPGPFQTPENQDVSTSMILFQGNFTINNRRRLGALRGITTS